MGTPQRLGRYEVVKHLASGGMAEVLLAHYAGRYVVLKRILGDQANDERFVRMFLDEARLASMLRHPNIVEVYEIGADNGEYFFAMEYVHGEDLRKVLMEVFRREDKLPIALVAGLVAAAAAGLHHAHTAVGPDRQPLNIVHRDVSPANILVAYDGRVKVADFGIAKAALRTVETRSGTLKGKVSYMSPEQITGKPIDRRSDVFALGIVLYEVATARRLFKGDNDFLTMSAITRGDIPPPHTMRPDLPRVLEEIIMKALATAPEDRYQTAEELGQALTKFTHSLGMRMSPSAVADYMKKLFGQRAEPWLVEDEPTSTASIDFDGSGSGLVQPPPEAFHSNMPTAVDASSSSPIAHVFTAATGKIADLPDVVAPTTGQLAWTNEPTRTPTQELRSKRRLGIVLGTAAAAVAVGGVVIVASSGGSRNETVKMKVAPPEPVAVQPQPPEPSPAPTPGPVVEAKAPDKPSTEPTVQTKPVTSESTVPKSTPKVVKEKVSEKKTEPPRAKDKVAAKTVKRPPRTTTPAKAAPKKSNWDPNALLPPK